METNNSKEIESHQDIDFEVVFLEMRNLLNNNEYDMFREAFLDLHTYEQSEFFLTLTEGEREKLYHFLSPKEVSDFFDSFELEPDEYEELFSEMDARYAAQVVWLMQYDNAVDILNELPKEMATTYLPLMNREDREEIRSLMNYEEDTAGGIMTTEFVSIDSEMTVRQAMEHLKKVAPNSETIYYLFVTDPRNKLAGIISLRDLIVAEDDAYIGYIMKDRVISVRVSDDQEEVANIVRDFGFLAVPVVDFQNHLVGIITADDIMDVIHEEAEEDYYKLAGMSEEGSPQ